MGDPIPGGIKSQIGMVKNGDHLCLLYENQAEQMAAAVPYIADGLQRGERCVYIADDQTVEQVSSALAGGGVDVGAYVSSKALVLSTKRDSYLRLGSFDPENMLDDLRQLAAETSTAGFAGLRITGEMTWALGPEAGCDRIIEYEALLNQFFPGSRASAICQYNRAKFPAEIILDVLRTHPLAILRDHVCRNLYYEPPELIQNPGHAQRRVQWMSEQLQAARADEERLVEKTGQLAYANAQLKNFAFATSHDLQEPLRTLSLYCQLLARRFHDELGADGKEFIGYITGNALRIQRLVGDLLAYAVVTGSSLHRETVDMRMVARQALQNLESVIRESGAQVEIGEMPVVSGSYKQLANLLQNLLGNAVKYRRPGVAPRVQVRAQKRGSEWLFSVVDNGAGIHSKYRASVFDVFKRLHGQELPGSGLGLAISHGIVENHGGRIWLESQVGAGSTFYFTLPALSREATAA